MVKKLNDGVGKKIVEALKQQSEASEQNQSEFLDIKSEDQTLDVSETINNALDDVFEENNELENIQENNQENTSFDDINLSTNFDFDTNPINDLSMDFMTSNAEIEESLQNHEPKEISLPSNIIILKKLISQLPSGVTRHTGALIIKQTMEALGISMKSVLREAQEVQENLKTSSKECQLNIQDYKKQISILEKKVQNYQKQYNTLNDLISLFIQTN